MEDLLLTMRELFQQEVEVAYLGEELRLGLRGGGASGDTASEVGDTLGREEGERGKMEGAGEREEGRKRGERGKG